MTPVKRMPTRRGAIYVLALGVIVVLSGLILVFAQEMRTEALTAANRQSMAQAEAIEQGAEQWVLAQIDQNLGDPVTITEVPAEALQLGTGYFWVIHPDPDSTDNYAFGIADEAGKLNLNAVTSTQLMLLPGMTQELADSIVEWRGGNSSSGVGGAYYEALPDPYSLKRANYETVEELMLIADVTPELLWGMDRNRDGVLSDAERNGGGAAASNMTVGGVDDDGRGIAQYLTAWSAESNVRVGGGGGGQGGGGAAQTVTGRVNINTAPVAVLQALGFSQTEADSIVSTRQSVMSTGTTWLSQAVGAQRAIQFQQYVTGNSNQFSADIVAVSGDGRAFKRVKIVIEGRTTPIKVVYRKELSDCGWPLPKEIRDSLRSGKGLPSGVQGSGSN